jgi:hypothetical protein
MALTESYTKRLKEIAGISLLKRQIQEGVDLSKDAQEMVPEYIDVLYEKGTSDEIHKFLEEYSRYINKENKIKLKIIAGDIEEYDELLDFSNNPITHLGKLKYTSDSIWLKNTKIKTFNSERIEGGLDLRDTPMESLFKLKYIGRNCDLSDSNIKSLGELEMVRWNLILRNTPISFIGDKLKYIGHNLVLNYNMDVEELPEDLHVGIGIMEQ